MIDRFADMPISDVGVDFTKDLGIANMRCHSTGIGGIHPMPMPGPVIEGIRRLELPLVRVFLQEFFFIYSDDGSFDWSKLDPYMDAVHATGAQIMASICLKPRAVFPVIDENVWRPSDVEKWQHILSELVKRYSIERDYVQYWSVGNETNIGEAGGCPYRITSPDDFFEYYKLTVAPILAAVPHAKVGGPSHAGTNGATEYLGRFAELCMENDVPLHFVNYNQYCDDPAQCVNDAARIKAAISKFDSNIGVYVTELNIGIDSEIYIEEKAYSCKRAAGLAAILIALHEEGSLDGTFQYHAYDQYCDPRLFAPWYGKPRYMAEYWDDIAHRLGLFDLNGNVHPQYFVYDMLKKLAPYRIEAEVKNDSLYAIASREGEQRITIFMSNYRVTGAVDTILQFRAEGMPEGMYHMQVTRIDEEVNLCKHSLVPTEDRRTYVHPDFRFAVFAPANSVLFIEFIRED